MAPTAPPAFDIVSTYKTLLYTSPDLSPPIAAIESLIQLLTSSPPTTISETLTLLSQASHTLLSALPNPIPASAGTDHFQRYLMQALTPTTFSPPTTPTSRPPLDPFPALRQHLLSSSRHFAHRSQEARQQIAENTLPFIPEGATVLTTGGSRVVASALLRAAAASTPENPPFRVIYLSSPTAPRSPSTAPSLPRQLLDAHIPTSTISFPALLPALSLASIVLVGAEAVTQNGGVTARLGTHQLAVLAYAAKKPLYVLAEGFKFARAFPVVGDGHAVEGVRQRLVMFEGEDGGGSRAENRGPKKGIEGNAEAEEEEWITQPEEMVDFTPPELIAGFITENGVLDSAAVSEEAVNMWF